MSDTNEFPKTVQFTDLLPTTLPKVVKSQEPLLPLQTYDKLISHAEWSEKLSYITPVVIGILVGQLSESSVATILSCSVASYLILRIGYANDLRWLINNYRN